jgi:hypothetical protein
MKSNRDREIFKMLSEKFKGTGLVPSPGFLRVEKTLTNSNGSYKFDIKDTSGYSASEVKLDRNDLFVITDLAIYLLKEDTTKVGANCLQTFPNELEFVAAAGFTPAHLETIYNGKFSLKIASRVNIEAMSMQQFRKVPQTQQTATVKNQYSVEEAVYSLPSLLFIKGTMDVEPKVDFNTFDGMQIQAVAANTNNKLVFHPYGFLIKSGATVDLSKK